jgi:hypothetical protein
VNKFSKYHLSSDFIENQFNSEKYAEEVALTRVGFNKD